MKKICVVWCVLLSMFAARAEILLMDSSNYPYANGLIAGQGQWYVYYPKTPAGDAFVANNVLQLNTTNHDEVATPTNGWVDAGYTYASFQIVCTQLPTATNGGYFCQYQNNDDTNDVCHVFLDTIGTTVPGTYRLGIGNYTTSFNSLQPPYNFPMDLATNTPYTVVILFDNNGDDLQGATLWINPSENDWENADDLLYTYSPGIGVGYAYGTDTTTSTGQLNIAVSQIGFSTYADAGISNVIAATTFPEVNTTNLPVWGIQPQPQTNYSGNSATYYAVASAVDVTYQWYSKISGTLHDDGVNIIGSTSNTLVINNFEASDGYYSIARDAYGNTITSLTATNDVITTPTAPFFPPNVVVENLTNNLFTSTGFTNIALGTGPLSYQWYSAPTNSPNNYSPLSGQTSPALNLNLADYTYAGNYYVVVSNSVNGGSIAYGPTNSITVIAPVVASLPQLHALMISESNLIVQKYNGTLYINTNNVTVGGYVTSWSSLGNSSSSYSEYFIQNNGFGIEVYSASAAHSGINTNNPPIGTYVLVTGPVEVYDTSLEIAPASPSEVVPTNAPVQTLPPLLANSIFNNLSTNGYGTNAMDLCDSLMTFTNVYIYGTSSGGALGGGGSHSGVGGIFDSNSYVSIYFTVGGPYGGSNTNTINLFQPAYNYTTNSSTPGFVNQFDGQPIPATCYQLTGVYENYEGTPELEPSRLADYIVNPPSSPAITIAETKGVPTLMGSPLQTGSTYSVQAATNLNGPWVTEAYGLGYWPTNVTFTDTNLATAKFYLISSP